MRDKKYAINYSNVSGVSFNISIRSGIHSLQHARKSRHFTLLYWSSNLRSKSITSAIYFTETFVMSIRGKRL